MPTTSNFGWTTPADTDLVKDGALAIRTLGNGIDTSMAELKGGTTGQVLSKTSNTDMDFTWVTQDDANAIQNAIVDAKGDLITATAADTPARLAVGTNGQVLTADSTASTGLKWAAPSSGALTLITRATYSAVANTGTTFDNVFSSTYKTYLIAIENSFAATATDDMYFQLRYAGPTTQAATYIWTNDMYTMATAGNTTAAGNGTNYWQLANDSATTAERFSGQYWLTNAETTTRTQMIGQGLQGNTGVAYNFYGYQYTNRTYTGFILSSSSSNISGTVAVYGLATA